jgi:hypothetical protein
MKHSQKKNFIDSITGLCSVDVVGERDSWNVMLTVTYRDKDETEKHTGETVPVGPGDSKEHKGLTAGDTE